MILLFSQILPRADALAMRDRLAADSLVDGAGTAGPAVRDIKRNRELPLDSPLRKEFSARIQERLEAHRTFTYGVLPKRVGEFLFSRYDVGMTYGDHMDNPIMRGGAAPLRTDLSMTIFLTDPQDYDGGELVMQSDSLPSPIKLPAGDAVVYPSGTIHRVEPVTRGTRWAAITWVQSMIRSPEQRQVLWDLLLVHDWMMRNRENESEDQLRARRHAEHARYNLVRMWSDP